MPVDTFDSRYTCALQIIKDAGDIAHDYFKKRSGLTIKSKGLQDMASEADLNTELFIRNQLQADFPNDAFLGEETGITQFSDDQGIWVVDPIDGTQPFVTGMSSWCVSIGFVQNGVLRFGTVYAPERGELFAGGENHPATLNGEPLPEHPGGCISNGIIGIGYSSRITPDQFLPTFTTLLNQGAMFYRDGSGALALCYVAAGRLLGYLELHINSWDCLGAIAVIRAAGLSTNNFLENDGLAKGNMLIAGTEEVYAELADIVKIKNRLNYSR